MICKADILDRPITSTLQIFQTQPASCVLERDQAQEDHESLGSAKYAHSSERKSVVFATRYAGLTEQLQLDLVIDALLLEHGQHGGAACWRHRPLALNNAALAPNHVRRPTRRDETLLAFVRAFFTHKMSFCTMESWR